MMCTQVVCFSVVSMLKCSASPYCVGVKEVNQLILGFVADVRNVHIWWSNYDANHNCV